MCRRAPFFISQACGFTWRELLYRRYNLKVAFGEAFFIDRIYGKVPENSEEYAGAAERTMDFVYALKERMRYDIFKTGNLETHGLFVRFMRIFSVPLLNLLPQGIIRRLMQGSSRDAATVIQHRGSALALEVMYTRYHRTLFSRGILQGIADLFWHHFVSQPKALRNRLRIVEQILEEELISRLNKREKVTIISLGGGSARGIMQTLRKVSEKNSIDKVRVINIDKDARALDLSKELARKFGLHRLFEWKNEDTRSLNYLVQPESADIIELVGLLDYFSDETAISLMKKIYNVLKRGGFFIFANVYPNPEVPFVNKTGWPNMYYREPQALEGMLKAAGFDTAPKIVFEPLRVHIIAFIKKRLSVNSVS